MEDRSTEKEVRTGSPGETHMLAAELAVGMKPGTVLALHGELGAGKTCFVQGLAEALGSDVIASSPTYTLINEYKGQIPIYHIDLYRISDANEAFDFGLDEYLYGDGITAIEWAERVSELLPKDTIHIFFDIGDHEDERRIRIHSTS